MYADKAVIPYQPSESIHPSPAAATALAALPNGQQSKNNGRTSSYPSTSPAIDVPLHSSLFAPPPYSQLSTSVPLGQFSNPGSTSTDTQKSSVALEASLNPDKVSQDSINQKKRQFYQNFKERLATRLHSLNDTEYGIYDFNKDGYTRRELPPGINNGCCLDSRLVRYKPTRDNEQQIVDQAPCCNDSSDCCSCYVYLPNAIRRAFRSNDTIPTGIEEFSTRIALGLAYRFQELIPFLTPKGIDSLMSYFEQVLTQYTYGTSWLIIYNSISRKGYPRRDSFSRMVIPPKQSSVHDVLMKCIWLAPDHYTKVNSLETIGGDPILIDPSHGVVNPFNITRLRTIDGNEHQAVNANGLCLWEGSQDDVQYFKTKCENREFSSEQTLPSVSEDGKSWLKDAELVLIFETENKSSNSMN